MTIDQKDNLRLVHILEAIEYIEVFIEGVSKEDFENNYEKQSAIIRQFEIIGEAASKLTLDFLKTHHEVDWSKVIGMRHKMIHDYFDVDISIVWNTISEDIQPLKKAISKIKLNNMLKGVTPKLVGGEIDWGIDRGKEKWID